jgi:hypothetical protein
MSLRKQIKKTSFWQAKELIESNKKKFFYVFLIDLLFFLVLAGIRFFLIKRELTVYDIYDMGQSALLLFSISYVLFLLLFYSLLKYLVTVIIKSAEHKSEFSMKGFLKFVWLNILLGVVLAFVFNILSAFIVFAVKEESIPAVYNCFLVLIALLSYLYVNISHILFAFRGRILFSIIKPTGIIFKEARVYFPLLLNIAAAIIFYLILASPLLFLRAESVSALKITYITIFSVLFYILLFFNRVQLFSKLTNFK